MLKKEYYVIGATHIDLAWKKNSEEMAEMLEIFVIRLLDSLERHPSFKYMIEQAAHYRSLALHRPDLLKKLKHYIKEGRVEMLGGMASTLETNIPNGECFVRNQLIGMRWVKENLDTDIETGWLVDTFGINAQVPQILNQFGIQNLMANRFGGNKYHDIFLCRGLDGSEVLIVGRDVFSAYVKPGSTVFSMCSSWEDIEKIFSKAAELESDIPVMAVPYTENEIFMSLRPLQLIERLNGERQDAEWKYSLPREYYEALRKADKSWPVENGDLNPEFTGTFSLRTKIRTTNRKVENLLLEAEKWAVLSGLKGWDKKIEDAWWEMAFTQFHDVFTGSHPTNVFNDVMHIYEKIEILALQIIESVNKVTNESLTIPSGKISLRLLNGLPWARTDAAVICLPDVAPGQQVAAVTQEGKLVPYEVVGGQLRFLAELPALSVKDYLIEYGQIKELAPEQVEYTTIENEYIMVECDSVYGIKRLVWKQTGKVFLENTGDYLVVQQDDGNFQIELPVGSEVPASAGQIKVFKAESSDIREGVIISGVFPTLSWAGDNNYLTWELELNLFKGKPRLDMKLKMNWKGENSRIRLKLPTTLEAWDGIYEIPFGIVRRKPYPNTGNARGEWPAHRFVAIEDKTYGMALINTGVVGVEVNGGTLWTTLIRAPKGEYAGMISDDTSSQHGEHEFNFVIMPYSGTWSQAGIVSAAQEVNNPFHPIFSEGALLKQSNEESYIELSSNNIVLSAVKALEDGTEEIVLRFYETCGSISSVPVFVKGAQEAWNSNMREQKLESLHCDAQSIYLEFKPYEIKTIRVKRKVK